MYKMECIKFVLIFACSKYVQKENIRYFLNPDWNKSTFLCGAQITQNYCLLTEKYASRIPRMSMYMWNSNGWFHLWLRCRFVYVTDFPMVTKYRINMSSNIYTEFSFDLCLLIKYIRANSDNKRNESFY